jgi:hypothetical protein
VLNLLLGSKGSAVGALAFGGISLVGNYLNFVKRAVVFGVAVVFALSNGAADRFIGGIASSASAGICRVVHNGTSFQNLKMENVFVFNNIMYSRERMYSI